MNALRILIDQEHSYRVCVCCCGSRRRRMWMDCAGMAVARCCAKPARLVVWLMLHFVGHGKLARWRLLLCLRTVAKSTLTIPYTQQDRVSEWIEPLQFYPRFMQPHFPRRRESSHFTIQPEASSSSRVVHTIKLIKPQKTREDTYSFARLRVSVDLSYWNVCCALGLETNVFKKNSFVICTQRST